MKKTLLAVAIPAVLFAHSAFAVEILKTDEAHVDFYGQLRTEVKKSEGTDVTLNAGSSRAGVQAQYAVTDSVDIFGKVEFGLNYNTAKEDYTMKNRLHFAGVDTDFGKLSFGRQWVVADDIYGADYSYFFGGTALRYSSLSGARHDSLIKYNYEGENFIVAANYGLPEDDTNQELAELYVASSYGGFNFHVGGGVNRDKSFKIGTEEVIPQPDLLPNYKETIDITADLQNTYFEGTVEYTVGAALIGFTYYNAELKNKGNGNTIDEDGYSLAGTYSWADNATAYAGYEYTEQESKALNADGDGKLFYIGTDYHFNSWSRIYVEYAYADGDTLGYTNKGSDRIIEATSVDGDSKFALGARVYW
ncbi:porin [Photobacterium lutimaris]|uniref:Porin n=1 Tax=Photobacterium lutimaris TaxID=388278 RepID=A0A2T3J297_9GAMM|nr:porin [Photobacterium lutimaris]PSU35173.1 porin [Photobacterium lutimaris]TDR77542.1 outer membrane protein OmpT [Photobacterium lutimaris]